MSLTYIFCTCRTRSKKNNKNNNKLVGVSSDNESKSLLSKSELETK